MGVIIKVSSILERFELTVSQQVDCVLHMYNGALPNNCIPKATQKTAQLTQAL